jgi:limonene-1,2-epoxide hydrolase
MSLTTGVDEALAALDGFEANLGMVAMTVDMHSIVALGDKVLTERVDHILTADGSVAASIRIMGIIETSGGKITAWRDYFDTAGLLGGG